MSEQEQEYQIKAGLERVAGFRVAGVSVVTSNEKAAEDINALWERFFTEQVGQKLDGLRADDVIYAVYSDYEGDHTKPYRYTIGFKIEGDAPEGLHAVDVEGHEYAALSASGPQPQALVETWTAIWEADMPRAFNTDFEVYSARFFEDGVHEVLIYIGLKEEKNEQN